MSAALNSLMSAPAENVPFPPMTHRAGRGVGEGAVDRLDQPHA